MSLLGSYELLIVPLLKQTYDRSLIHLWLSCFQDSCHTMYSILASCCLPLKGAVVWRQNNPYVTEPPHSTSLPTSLSRQHQPFWCACPVGVCHSNGPYPSAQETPRDWQEYYIISSGHFDKIFELNWSNSPTPSSQHTQIHRGTSPCVTLRHV